MEAALRTVYEVVTGNSLEERLEFTAVRGFDGIREASLQIGDLTVKVAIVHGLANAKKMVELVREGKADYQFIEVMSCPGGCIGGGGNAPTIWKKLAARRDAIYQEDRNLPIRKSHELLHTHYISRRDLIR